MKMNKRGIALFLAIALVSLGMVLIVGMSTLLSSYFKTSLAAKKHEYAIDYANMALGEIKWNIQKQYKKWLYDATHTAGDDGVYDYLPMSQVPDDALKTSNDDSEYHYSAINVSGIGDTYWIKVVDHYIWSDGNVHDSINQGNLTNQFPLGRSEGWVRIAKKATGDSSDFSYVYDVFCKGTSYRGVKLKKVGSTFLPEDSEEALKVRKGFILATAKNADSLSLSEFNIAVFDGYLNVGAGYNVFGRIHANKYVNFINSPSRSYSDIAVFHNVLSVGDPSKVSGGRGFLLYSGRYGSFTTQSQLNTHVNDIVTLNNGTDVKTFGFDYRNRYAFASFEGDEAKPAIIDPIKPKTKMHFSKVRNSARKYGILVENANVAYLYLDPGDISVNGDGKVIFKANGGTVYVNGVNKGGAGWYEVNIGELESPVMYVDGDPGTKEYYSSACDSGSGADRNRGWRHDDRIYRTKGIRGVTGVLDGQFSIFSGYDIVIAGDIIYQEFTDKIKYTYTNYANKDFGDGTGNAYGKVFQQGLKNPAAPDPNEPNLLGLNAMHDIIIPGNMFDYYTRYGSIRYASYNGGKADRVDSEGKGILSGSAASGDGYPDIFTFGVLYAGHRVYGEVSHGYSANHTYSRPSYYVNKKGTWFIYGCIGSYQQVYATSGPNGFAYRSYNYDPNLYTFEPPYTIKIEGQSIWSWRIVSDYPPGLSEK